MSPLDTDANNRAWGVYISKNWRLGDLWIFHCFPAYLDGQSPKYPGFDVFKLWININCPSAVHQVRYLDGSSKLEVTFNNAEEAMLFRLRA